MNTKPIFSKDIGVDSKKPGYPEPFSSQVGMRLKRKMGDHFDLSNFGVNLTTLEKDSMSALQHKHTTQDEFIYILSGTPTLILGDDEYLMNPGDCVGFKAGDDQAHHLVNRNEETVMCIEIGDRSISDQVEYPNDDLAATYQQDGSWLFAHKNGSKY